MIEELTAPLVSPWPLQETSVLRNVDKALLVYRDIVVGAAEPPVSQMLSQARVLIPALMNYLFFSTTQVAVLYFGKRVNDGQKCGISEGTQDMKIKMIRFLTTEIWPPLLRTDAPDDSLAMDHSFQTDGHLDTRTSRRELSGVLGEWEEDVERSWFRKSIENGMQVLVYLKSSPDGSKYLKLILSNISHRIHFDIVDSKEEKLRWDNRMLFTRILDNLETQKAIDSYESYERYFRQACEMAAQYQVDLERPEQPMVTVTFWDAIDMSSSLSGEGDAVCSTTTTPFEPGADVGTALKPPLPSHRSPSHSSASAATTPRSRQVPPIADPSMKGKDGTGPSEVFAQLQAQKYQWMRKMEQQESTTLDYKSYFAQPEVEIEQRSVKFMCGFLNAYREGKLVIGVHEMPRNGLGSQQAKSGDRSGACTPTTRGAVKEDIDAGVTDDGNTIVVHNDLIDQYVVGISISDDDIWHLHEELSGQLLECIPPIPPKTVRFDVFPVQMPDGITHTTRVLILYDSAPSPPGRATGVRDTMRQRSNFVIRLLFRYGLSLAPIPQEKLDHYLGDAPGMSDCNFSSAQAFAVVPISKAYASVLSDCGEWVEKVSHEFESARGRVQHLLLRLDDANAVPIPPLRILEISVDIRRCGFAPLMAYRGKFFNGWPSIPLWDPATKSVRRVERNYALLQPRQRAGNLATIGTSSNHAAFAIPRAPVHVVPENLPRRRRRDTFTDAAGGEHRGWSVHPHTASVVLSFLYNLHDHRDILQFRLLNSTCNSAFEARQGIRLVTMLHATPLGTPNFGASPALVSRMQYALHRSGVPLLPLIMCRVFETIGLLPSPYPFVAVPLVQQSFRVASCLVPLLYHQKYYDGQLKQAVVLDLRDGYVKTIRPSDRRLVLEAVIGVGFETITSRHLAHYVSMSGPTLQRTQSRRHTSRTASVFRFGGGANLVRGFLARHPPRHANLSGDRGSTDTSRHMGSPFTMARTTSMVTAANDSSYCDGSQRDLLVAQSSVVLASSVMDRDVPMEREMERNIPLVHFKFLTQSQSKSTSRSCACSLSAPWDPAAMVPGESSSALAVSKASTSACPWTLQHLLSWFGTVIHDSHVKAFGYCDRSFAFYIPSLKEVCLEHVESLVDCDIVSPEDFAPGSGECLLHRTEQSWREV